MMKTLITGLIILFSSTCFSQTNVIVFSGINFPTFPLGLKESSFVLTQYWKNALNFGASLELKLSNSLYLSPGFEYNLYPFDSYDGPNGEPVIVNTISGNNSNIYRFLLEIKHFPEASSKSKSQPFLSTGFGYIVEDIGNIIVSFDYFNGREGLIKFDGKSYFVHTAGIGMRWRLTEKMKLNLEGKIFTDYKNRFQNSWNLGFLFSF